MGLRWQGRTRAIALGSPTPASVVGWALRWTLWDVPPLTVSVELRSTMPRASSARDAVVFEHRVRIAVGRRRPTDEILYADDPDGTRAAEECGARMREAPLDVGRRRVLYATMTACGERVRPNQLVDFLNRRLINLWRGVALRALTLREVRAALRLDGLTEGRGDGAGAEETSCLLQVTLSDLEDVAFDDLDQPVCW